jgi:hypothetical protein
MYNHERYILFKSSMIIAQGSIELSQEKINFCRFIFDFELKNYFSIIFASSTTFVFS